MSRAPTSVLYFVGATALTLAISLITVLLWQGADLRHVSFLEPWWFLAALVPVVVAGFRMWKHSTPASLHLSRATFARRLAPGWITRLADLPDAMRLVAALLLVIALARPQSETLTEELDQEGIDIAIAIDLSESMAAEDLPPDRLHAAKVVVEEFIRRRTHDRIGVVAFGETASTVAPLTADHDVLRALVSRLRLGTLSGTSTAIGAGLGIALNRLDESPAKSKVIVLLTDGVQTAGGVHPDTMATEAASRGVKIYTILMGRHESESVDPAQLERIAAVTGGYAYTATDFETLKASFLDLLDKLERSRLAGQTIRAELFAPWIWAALVLIVMETILRNTRLRRFP
jgi:Ca-activated chloride channel family protein